MSENWLYQIRFKLSPENAALIHSGKSLSFFDEIIGILERHNASAVCQYNAFAGYVAEAEKYGIAEYPLYKWTKATIEDTEKKQNIWLHSQSTLTTRKFTQKIKPTLLKMIYVHFLPQAS